MNIAELGTVFAISTAVASGVGTAGKFYLDHNYVGSSAIVELEIRQLKRELRRLQRLEAPTPQEQWEINDLADEIEDLEAQRE